ncbi:MAG: 16S rRNA (guanine(527)-N(7))-methyltransferase RsmG [Chitinophagaceae bacterium]|nr:16S rRNA (guanine(527)-N(7))-methyltransferase RsmG [Chitinophagaceae bacterium]
MDVLLLYPLCLFTDQKTQSLLEIITKYFSGFNDTQIRQLGSLQELYRDWNSRINVISRKDMDHFYEHHVLHSLSIATRFTLTGEMQVMDLGCGGGFPGIPLAIFFPDTPFLMVDSINKKLTVVREIAQAIGLTNISTLHARAEEIRNRKFDLVVSRAVAPLKDLWRWSRPLLKKNQLHVESAFLPNGLVCLKGGDLSQEIFESGCKPMVWEIEQVFPEPYFREKYMLYIPLK